MDNFLKFSVDNIKFVDEVEKSFFRKIKIKAFSSGDNAHTLPVEEDVIRRGAKTIYNKPILWKYNKYFDDAEGHEKDEVPCGFVPETEDNPVEFVNENGRLYIVINALLWTKYSGKLIEIFKRDGNKKDVSVEMQVIDNRPNQKYESDVQVDDFVIAGITILGEMINPACKGCQAELLEFSENKKKYLEEIEFSENAIEIDNSKESSVGGSWSNPRRKLFNPILKAPNKRYLLKEAYLIGDFDSVEPEITKFKYPHHVIRDGKLVLHKDGLQAAFSRASQQGIVDGNIKSHLLKHYRELGLSTENFSEFNISEEQFRLYFSDDFSVESVGDSNMTEEIKESCVEEVKETEDSKMEEIKEAEESCEKMENINESEESCEKMEEDDSEDETNDEDKEDEDKEEDNKEEDMSVEEMSCKMKEMSERISELEECNKAYMAQIESMSDYEDLKKFKCETEERMAREKEMADMEKVMSDIENRGVCMSEDDKKEFMGKIKEFSSIDAWSNYVKATVFDNAENVNGVVKMGLPYTTEKKSIGSIWDEL